MIPTLKIESRKRSEKFAPAWRPICAATGWCFLVPEPPALPVTVPILTSGSWRNPSALATFYKMEDLLEEIPTLYRIDWVDLNRVSPEFRREALKQTEVLCG